MDPDLIYEKGVRYYTTPFDISEALKSPDVKIEDLLNIDGFVEELRGNSTDLLKYFQKNKLPIKRLIDFITKEPRDSQDKKRCYKYPFLAREIFNIGIPVIEDAFFETETSLSFDLRFRDRAFSTRRSISYDDEDEILRTRQDNINFIQKIDEIPEKQQDDSDDSGDDDSDDDEPKKAEEKPMEVEKNEEAVKEGAIQEEPKANAEEGNEKPAGTKGSAEPVSEPTRKSTGEGPKLRKKNSRKSSDQRLKSKKSNPPSISVTITKEEDQKDDKQPSSPQPNPLQIKDLNLVNYLFGFLCREVTNPTLAGYFEVCVKNLMNHKTSKLVDYIFESSDVITNLIKNIGNKSIMEIFCRVILIERVLMDVDPEKFEAFLSKKKQAIKCLVYKLKGNTHFEELENITYCIEQILVSKNDDILDASELKAYLLGDEIPALVFKILCDNMESAPQSMYYITLIINSLLKCYSPDYLEPSHLAIMSQSLCIEVCSLKSTTNNFRETLSLIQTHFDLLYEILFKKNDEKIQMPSGEACAPLGFLKLNIIKIFHMCFKINDPDLFQKLRSKKVIADLIHLFEKYPWNNILHEVLVKLVSDVIRGCNADVYKHILEEAKIMELLMDLARKGMFTFSGKNQNQTSHGYLGHVIKLINLIIDVANKEYFMIKSYTDKISEWPKFASSILKECNDRNNKNLEEVSEKRTSDILDKIGRVMETQKGGRKVSSENPLEETPSDIMYKKITQTIDYDSSEKSFQSTSNESGASADTEKKEEKEKMSQPSMEIESKDHQFIEPQKQIFYDFGKSNEKEVFFLPEGGESGKKPQESEAKSIEEKNNKEEDLPTAKMVPEEDPGIVENKQSEMKVENPTPVIKVELEENKSLEVPSSGQDISKSPRGDTKQEVAAEPQQSNPESAQPRNLLLEVNSNSLPPNALNSPTNPNISSKMVVPSPNTDSARKGGRLAWKSQRNEEVVSKVVKTEEIITKSVDSPRLKTSLPNPLLSNVTSEMKPVTKSSDNLPGLLKSSSEVKASSQSKFATRRFSKDDMEIEDIPDEKTTINTSGNKTLLGLSERNTEKFDPKFKYQDTSYKPSSEYSSGLLFKSDPLSSSDKYLSGIPYDPLRSSLGSSYGAPLGSSSGAYGSGAPLSGGLGGTYASQLGAPLGSSLGSYGGSNLGYYSSSLSSSLGGTSYDDIIKNIHNRTNIADPLLSRHEPSSNFDNRYSYNESSFKSNEDLGPSRANQSVGGMIAFEKEKISETMGAAGKKIFDKADEKKVNLDSNI